MLHKLLPLLFLGAASAQFFGSKFGPFPARHPTPLNCRYVTSGPTICGCYDPGTGRHEHNETWISGLRWKMRCNNGTLEIEACIGSRRGNYVEVPVNQTVEVNKFWHKCEDSQSNIRYSQEPSCIVNGEEIHINDTFRQNNFELACQEWGYSITGCYYNNKDGDEVRLDVGGTQDEDIFRHFCEPVPPVPGRVRYRVQAVKCKHGGKIYDEGETWTGKHLKYLCKNHGAVKIINCVTAKNTEIAIGQALVIDNVLHRCYRAGNTVYYQANGCGLGPACRAGALRVPPYVHYPPTSQGEWPLVFSSGLSGPRASTFQKPPF